MEQYSLEQQMLSLRGKLGGLYDYDFQPVPFAYWNIASWLNAIYLPLLSYTIGYHYHAEAYIAWVGVVLISFSLLGLSYLASMMAKPYGSEIYDFDVYHFLNFTCKASRKLLEPVFMPAEDAFEPSPEPDPGDFLSASSAAHRNHFGLKDRMTSKSAKGVKNM